MFVITPFLAAVLVGTFWSGVAVTAVGGNHWDHNADVQISATTTDHQDACSARYHSYRTDTDSWLGRDGKWHVCIL